jgi:hypothetical protein
MGHQADQVFCFPPFPRSPLITRARTLRASSSHRSTARSLPSTDIPTNSITRAFLIEEATIVKRVLKAKAGGKK